MKINKIITLSIFPLIIGFTIATMAQNRQVSTASHMNASTQSMAEPEFLEKMSQHHQQAVEMANMALEKSQNKEVRKMSQTIIKAQTKEISQLQAWKKKWYLKTEMQAEMPKMDMTKMHSKTGTDFDKTFLDMMSEHHESAISMSKEVAPDLQHREVKNFAKKVVKAQTAEIKKMEKIKSSIQ